LGNKNPKVVDSANDYVSDLNWDNCTNKNNKGKIINVKSFEIDEEDFTISN